MRVRNASNLRIGAATRHDKEGRKEGRQVALDPDGPPASALGRNRPNKKTSAAAGARADRGIHQSFNRDAIEQSFLGAAERLHGLRRRATPRRRRHLAGLGAERMITPARRCCPNRHSGRTIAPMPAQLEHDPEKWIPVFGKDHAPTIT